LLRRRGEGKLPMGCKCRCLAVLEHVIPGFCTLDLVKRGVWIEGMFAVLLGEVWSLIQETMRVAEILHVRSILQSDKATSMMRLYHSRPHIIVMSFVNHHTHRKSMRWKRQTIPASSLRLAPLRLRSPDCGHFRLAASWTEA